MINRVTNWLLPIAMWVIARTNRKTLQKAIDQPEETQRRLMLSMIRENAGTDFGIDHNFREIADWDSFRRNVAIQTYESLESYIKKQIENGDNAIVNSKILSVARTSGTSGAAKDIPTTTNSLAAMKDAQRQSALTLHRDTNFFTGKILAFFSSHVEGRLENGMAYGSSSGQANRNTSLLMRSKFAYPYALSKVTDYDLKYYLYALFGILEPDVTGIAAANPSSVARIAEMIRERHAELAGDLEAGTIRRLEAGAGTEVCDAFEKLHRTNKSRAAEVVGILRSTPGSDLNRFWPRLDAIVGWTGGSCGVALERLRKMVGDHVKFVEIGYRASEFIGSINLDAVNNICVPTLHHTVFEFVEQSKWEAEQIEFTPISQLQIGANYYVIVTTASGLYRYNINDIVQVTGFHGACPTIQFLQKGKGVTSITGEKLYLHQVMEAVSSTQKSMRLSLESFLVLADEESARYNIYLESRDPENSVERKFAVEIDNHLKQRNIEYADKRKSGRLKPPETFYLKMGAGEAIKRSALKNGQRESQYKPPCLEYASKFDFDLEPRLISK